MQTEYALARTILCTLINKVNQTRQECSKFGVEEWDWGGVLSEVVRDKSSQAQMTKRILGPAAVNRRKPIEVNGHTR